MTTFGRFTFEEKLATGGMAEVWLAREPGTREAIVVKRVLPHLASNERFHEMLVTEARVVMGLEHRNIVRVFDVGEVDNVTYISMEYVPGSDLGRLLKRMTTSGGRVPTAVALRIARSLCEALGAVHAATDEHGVSRQLVHRDVSPQNVMISQAGVTKLLDFGIVKAFNDLALTEPGTIKGKFAYMSPEQAAGEALDGRSDLFAAALVIFELLSGVRAHGRDTEPGTYQAALLGEVVPLSKVWPDAPPELELLLDRALSVDRGQRFQTAAEFVRAIDAVGPVATENEVAAWANGLLVAARTRPALNDFSFEPEVDPASNLLTVDARPPTPVAKIALTSKPLELPPLEDEPSAALPPLELPPLGLPPDEPGSLMPASGASASAPRPAPRDPTTTERHMTSAEMIVPDRTKPPIFFASVVAVAVGVIGLVGSLNDPFDGFGQWLAPLGCAAFVLAGAVHAARLFERRELLIAPPVAGVALGLVRGDPLLALTCAALSAAMWLGSDDDPDHEGRSKWGLLAALPALVLATLGVLGAWLERAPAGDDLAPYRRQGTELGTGRVQVGDLLSFDATGWRVRPAVDVSGATEFTMPSVRATVFAKVVTLPAGPANFDALLATATGDFRKRGWSDFTVLGTAELVDQADESHHVDFRVRRGLTWSNGIIRFARVDDQLCVIATVVSERRALIARDDMRRVTDSARCSPGALAFEVKPETLKAVRESLVTLRSLDRVELGVVIQRRDGQMVIVADDGFLPETTPAAVAYRPLLTPDAELKRATVLRRKPGVVILLAPLETGLSPMPLAAPAQADTDVVTFGLADPLSSRLHVRPARLSRKALALDPHVTSRSGPVLSPEGTLVALLRNGEGATRAVTMQNDVEPFLVPGLHSFAWKLFVTSAHQCTLTARVDFDDPFQELTAISLLLGTPHQEDDISREAVAAHPNSIFTATAPCPLEKTVSLGLRVNTSQGTPVKLADSVEFPPEMPAFRQGQRFDPTRGTAPDPQVLSWLFEGPGPQKPVCAIEQCDQACTSGNGEACLLLGHSLMQSNRAILAVNDYERGCVAKNYEACVALAFLATPKTIDTYTPIIKPWCELGVRRACTALRATDWREQLKKEGAECAKNKDACDREAELLLDGPRRPADLQKALATLDRRCREGVADACVRHGRESALAQDLTAAIDHFDKACQAGALEGCFEFAALRAVGVGAPRNPELATKLLGTACDKGQARACAALGRNK